MSWPAPSREAHNQFCLNEGWHPVRNTRGRKTGHHITYELPLPDGRILRTRVSKPPSKDTYGARMWGHILRDQLQVDEETFWACVQKKVKPNRGGPEAPVEALPADLVHLLRANLHLSEAEIRGLSRQEAIERMTAFWGRRPD